MNHKWVRNWTRIASYFCLTQDIPGRNWEKSLKPQSEYPQPQLCFEPSTIQIKFAALLLCQSARLFNFEREGGGVWPQCNLALAVTRQRLWCLILYTVTYAVKCKSMRTTTEPGEISKPNCCGYPRYYWIWSVRCVEKTKSVYAQNLLSKKANFVNKIPSLSKLWSPVLLLSNTKLNIALYWYFEVCRDMLMYWYTRVGTLIVATIYLQLIQNRYVFRSFTVLHYSHQHRVQPVASDVKVVGYL